MITENSFKEILEKELDIAFAEPNSQIIYQTEAAEKCYGLAKQMAIGFGEYLNDVYAGKIQLVYGAKPSTPENLFDLYLQSKQNG